MTLSSERGTNNIKLYFCKTYFRFKRDETIFEGTFEGKLKAPAYDLPHQHKFPTEGKFEGESKAPSAPKEKPLHFPVPKDINPKSSFTIPPGAMDKPPVPDSLAGMYSN